jgi:hypothetical protein
MLKTLLIPPKQNPHGCPASRFHRERSHWSLILLAQLALGTAVVLVPRIAMGDDEGFRHEPPPEVIAGEDIEVKATLDDMESFRRARVRYRTQGEQAFRKADFEESSAGQILAIIPGSMVSEPALEYFIVLQRVNERVQVVFGTTTNPHSLIVKPVQIPKENTQNNSRQLGRVDTGTPQTPLATNPEENAGTAATKDEPPEKGDGPGASSDAGEMVEAPPRMDPKQPSTDSPNSEPPGETMEGTPLVLQNTPRVIRGGGVRDSSTAPVDPLSEAFLIYGARTDELLQAASSRVQQAESVFAQVWSRDDFRDFGLRTVGDVLKHFMGVETSLDILGYERVAVRALRKDARIRVLLDGQPLNNPYDGRVLWSLPVHLLETMHLETGPGTNSNHLSAGTAVLHLTTRKAEGLDAIVYGHSNWGGGIGLNGAGAIGPVQVSGGGHVSAQEGAHLVIEEDAYSESAFAPEDETMVTNARGIEGMAVGRLAYRFGESDAHELYAQSWLQSEWRGPYVGVFDTLGPNSQLVGGSTGATVGVDVKFGSAIDMRLSGTLDHHLTDHLIQLTPIEFETPDRDEDGTVEAFDSGVYYRRMVSVISNRAKAIMGVHPFEGNTIETGFLSSFSALPSGGYVLESNRSVNGVQQELGPLDDFATPETDPCLAFGIGIPAGGACRLSTSIFLNDTQTLFDRFQISAGLRLHTFSDVPFDLWSHLNPYVQALLFLTDNLSVEAKALTGITPPTLEEKYDQRALLYSDLSRGDYYGKPELAGEAFREIDLGVKYRIKFLQTAHVLRTQAYLTQVSNAIEKLPVNGIIEQITNAGDYYIGGVEGGWDSQLGELSRLFLNVSWFRSYWSAPADLDPEEPSCSMVSALSRDVLSDDLGDGCTVITDIPQLRANFGGVTNLGSLGSMGTTVHLGVARRGNGRTTLERIRQYEIPAYSLLNVTYRSPALLEIVGVWLEGTNVLNHPLKDDVPRPDRMPGLLPREGIRLLLGLYVQL